MAVVKHMRGVKLLVKVGDGAGPEVFTAPCTINAARGINFTANANEFNLPDCDDPDALAAVTREKVSYSCEITGAGILNTPDTETYFNWVTSANAKNVQVHLADVVGADGGGYWSGSFHCTAFNVTGDRGGKVEANITLQSNGAITWTDAA